MIRTHLGGEVFVAREGEQLQPIGRVVSVEWNLNRPSIIDVEQTGPIIGYDPAAPEQPYLSAMARGLAHGVARRRYRPGKLNETSEDFLTLQTYRRYPKRIDLARDRRRLAELNRRDRRRRRTGRAPIGLQGPVEVQTRLPRVQIAPPEIDGHLRLIVDHWSTLRVRMNAAVRDLGRSFAAMSQAFAAASTFTRSALEGVADRALQEGVTPAWTIRDDVDAYRRRVEAELTESSPYTTVDELRRQTREAEQQQEAERADRYRRELERLRARDGAAEAALEMVRRHGTRPFATGGVVYERRDPDNDTIPVRISPGEVWASPEMIRRHGSLLQALNGPGESILHPLGRDVTHHDRYLGEGNLERDETSGRHSLDSSGTGAVWTDLMARIDDLVDGEE